MPTTEEQLAELRGRIVGLEDRRILSAEILDRLSALLGRSNLTQVEVLDWWSGTPDGGPAENGTYPFTDSTGFIRMLPCPARLMEDFKGGGGNGLVRYLWEPLDPANSLGHQQLVVGATYPVAYGDGARQEGSAGSWRCLGNDGTAAPGSITFAGAAGGLIFTGEGAAGQRPRLAFVAGAGGRVDIRALLVRCDARLDSSRNIIGGTQNQRALIHTIRDAAIAFGWRLTGAGMIRVNQPIDMLRARLDMPDLIWKADGVLGAAAILSAGFAAGVRSATMWDVDVVVQGNNTFNHSPPSSEIGLSLYDVSSSVGRVRGRAIYCGLGFELVGNFEKLRPEFSANNCDAALHLRPDGPDATLTAAAPIGATVLSLSNLRKFSAGSLVTLEDDTSNEEVVTVDALLAGDQVRLRAPLIRAHPLGARIGNDGQFSPDTNRVALAAQNCRTFYREKENGDTFVHIELNCEARDDPGDDRPAVFIGNGKEGVIGGLVRAHNGERFLHAYNRRNNGANTLISKDLTLNHGYGTAFDFHSIHRLGGDWHVKDWSSRGAAGGRERGPMARFGQVFETGGSFFSFYNIKSDVGVQIGHTYTETHEVTGAVTVADRFPVNTTIRMQLEMGTSDPFTNDSPIKYRGIDWRMGRGVTMDATAGLKGNIKIGPTVEQGVLLLPSDWARSGGAFEIDPLADVAIDLGYLTSADVFGWSQARAGMIAYLTDYASSFRFDGVRWVPERTLTASDFALRAISSDFNRDMAFTGLQINSSRSGRPRYKVYPGDAGASWFTEAGDFVVGELGQTAGLVAKFTGLGLPEPSPKHRRAYDRYYFRLIEAGIYERQAVIPVLATYARAAALVNLQLDMPGAPEFFTEVGALTFIPDRGFLSNGAVGGPYIDTGWDPTVNPLGVSADDLSASAFALSGDAANGPDIGCDNGNLYVRARRHTSGAVSIGTIGRLNVAGAGTDFPHHIGGTTAGDAHQLYDNGRYSNQSIRQAVFKGVPNRVTLLAGFNSGISSGSPIQASNRLIAAGSAGRSHTPLQMKVLYQAQREFLRAVGAI